MKAPLPALGVLVLASVLACAPSVETPVSPGLFTPEGRYLLRTECVGVTFEHEVLLRESGFSSRPLEFERPAEEPCEGWSTFNGRVLVFCRTDERQVNFNGTCEPAAGPGIVERCEAGCSVLDFVNREESVLDPVPGQFSFELLDEAVP